MPKLNRLHIAANATQDPAKFTIACSGGARPGREGGPAFFFQARRSNLRHDFICDKNQESGMYLGSEMAVEVTRSYEHDYYDCCCLL